MAALRIIFLVFLILSVLVFAHDLYIFYNKQGAGMVDLNFIQKIWTETRPAREFDFATFGFVFLEYAPDLYKSIQQMTSPDQWKLVQVVLKTKIMYATAAPAIGALGLMIVIFVSRKLFGRRRKDRRSPASNRPKYAEYKRR